MGCCATTTVQRVTMISAVAVIILGVLMAVGWDNLLFKIVYKQLVVNKNTTTGFEMWKETPIPMYLEFNMFNWTNAEEYKKNPSIKPAFTEMGPYVFYEHHIRENITFNDNDTLTYLNKRIWRFEPDKSNGSLGDIITMLNPIPVVVASVVKDEHYIVKKAVNFILQEKDEDLYIKKEIGKILFEGYNDTLINIALKLNISGFTFPFKTFGWFAERNNSATYDGVYNMYSGGKDISKLGVITRWNYEHLTSYYPDGCNIVNGSSGELWYPPLNAEQISIFSPDLCSNVNLHLNGTETLYGIVGSLYKGEADVFDNGTYFESGKCYATELPTGVRSVSKCKFNAPAFMSFPHFYLSDPSFKEAVDGMNPDPDKHTTRLSLEPSTGLPLRVHASFQLNLLMRQMDGIDIYSKINTTLMPCFWFAQKAELTEDLSSMVKLIIVAEKVGNYTAYGLTLIGILLLIIYTYITYKRGWRTDVFWRATGKKVSPM
ncbi:protein croquemort [Anthonomus grandis grandis]|uniref:protein croquemort n=1 Tax=Anthonomus grandis grandis TaxID=2921223 RepID=UPI00216664C6|nr:protein croquemort [Anthonomus grandis grandis]XP_050299508.1 protein croquemort [Anthonomus grandis grandis]